MAFLKKSFTRKHLIRLGIALAVMIVLGSIFICSSSFVDVDDNGVVKKYFTWEKNVDEFFKKEGIVINQGDEVSAPKALAAFSKVQIIRGFSIKIMNGETELNVNTTKATVRDILNKNNVSFDDDDVVNYGLDDMIAHSVVICVDHVERVLETAVETIPMTTSYIRSADVYIGRHVEVNAGASGEKKVEYEATYVNGRLDNKKVISEQILSQPVARTIKVGTKGVSISSRGETLRYSRVLDVTAYAYSSGTRTATGTPVRVGVIAVDPKVIPLGTRVYVESTDGVSWAYGYAVAEDTGGSIKGNKVDLYMQSESLCRQFGIRNARVYILE